MPETDIFAEENQVQVRAFIPQNVEVQNYVGSVSVGNVTTLAAGSQATVTNVGDNTHAILDFGLPKGDSGSMWGELAGDLEDQTDLYTVLTGLETAIDGKAALSSPAFTGTPTAPTAVDGTDTTQIATTAFVKNAITNLQNSLQTYINTQVNKMLGRIDFSNAIALSQGAISYTVPSDGYIQMFTTGNNVILINGKEILSLSSEYGANLIPVSQGDVIQRYGSVGALSGSFFPQKTL